MDMRQLHYFKSLAEEGQISRAAKKLNMSQPPLSQQLQMMEEELGLTLIERKRNGKTMELTEAGKLFYEKAKLLIQQFEDSLLEVKETGAGMKGVLSIGSVLAYVSYLPEKMKQFKENHPLVSFKLFAGDPYEIDNYLENKDIELAIVYMPVHMKNITSIALGKVPNVLVVPENWHHWHSRDSISIKEVGEIPLLIVHREKGEGLYEEIVHEFEKIGMKPNILCECPDVNVLISLVSAGIGGAAIVPRSSVPPHMVHGVKVIEISDSAVYSNIALVWRNDRYVSRTAMDFIELFK
ncbi:LysR family transcriptional regulator [Bacillus sp. 1P06AnD]|uniref:LysR family transcriptional regulator n=1 Tax=Bacillus sp. 1P06AnD TaxID=3132208 RepID=UPI00399F5DE3